ncbi:zinc finger protein 467 isoform X2 [Heliangelus exortis]|uniref:zinc finger protein 467 isoform X2 n=1 Tax=Heliangelus exortis TaxID=472823 RepID=UPI003A8E051D
MKSSASERGRRTPGHEWEVVRSPPREQERQRRWKKVWERVKSPWRLPGLSAPCPGGLRRTQAEEWEMLRSPHGRGAQTGSTHGSRVIRSLLRETPRLVTGPPPPEPQHRQDPPQTDVPDTQKPPQAPEETKQQEEALGEGPLAAGRELPSPGTNTSLEPQTENLGTEDQPRAEVEPDPEVSEAEEASPLENGAAEEGAPENVRVKQEEEAEALGEGSAPSSSSSSSSSSSVPELQKCPRGEQGKAKSRRRPSRAQPRQGGALRVQPLRDQLRRQTPPRPSPGHPRQGQSLGGQGLGQRPPRAEGPAQEEPVWDFVSPEPGGGQGGLAGPGQGGATGQREPGRGLRFQAAEPQIPVEMHPVQKILLLQPLPAAAPPVPRAGPAPRLRHLQEMLHPWDPPPAPPEDPRATESSGGPPRAPCPPLPGSAPGSPRGSGPALPGAGVGAKRQPRRGHHGQRGAGGTSPAGRGSGEALGWQGHPARGQAGHQGRAEQDGGEVTAPRLRDPPRGPGTASPWVLFCT